MKQILSLLFFLSAFSAVFAQGNQWAWMEGDTIANQPGVYGIKGTPAPGNKPGARAAATSWTDASGNLWLFGGLGYAASGAEYILNDLWKWEASTGGWTWVGGDSTTGRPGVYGTKGTPAPGNRPGARAGAVSWTDASGNLWLFGGVGNYTDTGEDVYSDLWKYAPSTGEWTWISGDNTPNQKGVYGIKGTAGINNKPGARDFAATWTDASGNLWMFGGDGYNSLGYSGYLNDLWRYTLSTGQWTWISGDDTLIYALSDYGTKGIPAAGNKPGARVGCNKWTDAAGNLWIFGGSVYPVGSSTELSDLWKFVPATGLWTWIGGDSLLNQKGVYGTKGIPAAGNKPGARSRSVGWTDTSGNFWLLGGGGFVEFDPHELTYEGYLNDVWKYMPSTGLWTWVSGDSAIYQSSVYGIKGIAAAGNKPAARGYAVSWTSPSGAFWLFGGFMRIYTGLELFNDLWRYAIPSGATLPVQFNSFTARKQLQAVLLSWSTAQEQNSRSFAIERSSTGAVYDSIGRVAAGGNRSSVSNYSFKDPSPLPGINYYRIKQLDHDGMFRYSTVEKIMTDNDAVYFAVIQNPVRDALQVSIYLPAAQKLVLQVRDMSGQLLFSEQRMGRKGSAVYILPAGNLAKGAYLVSLQTGNLLSTKTFIR